MYLMMIIQKNKELLEEDIIEKEKIYEKTIRNCICKINK